MEIINHILSQEQLLDNLALYQSQLDDKLVDEPAVVMEQLTVAESIMVNRGKMLADAKYWLNEAMHSETIKTLKELASQNKIVTSTATNQLIKSLCKDQQYLVDLAKEEIAFNKMKFQYGDDFTGKAGKFFDGNEQKKIG